MSNIIFDFDGTLADTFDLIADVSYELTGAKRLPAEQLAALKSLPILAAIRRFGGSPWTIPKLMLLTRRRMKARIATVPIFDGIPQALQQLQTQGHTLFILSSNNTTNVAAFLTGHELAPYFKAVYTVPYGNAWLKARALRRISRGLGLDNRNCYYVGNEPLDVHAANELGIHAVAVTWSGQNTEDLTAAKPEFIIHTPEELPKLFAS